MENDYITVWQIYSGQYSQYTAKFIIISRVLWKIWQNILVFLVHIRWISVYFCFWIFNFGVHQTEVSRAARPKSHGTRKVAKHGIVVGPSTCHACHV